MMKHLSHNEIRNKWYDYFKMHKHSKLESFPVVPFMDDSLLFINAGMTPLKKYFDGTVIPENKRITTIQKCIRTNDIENVGVTARHLTFFEMMGNFSIGDYFKKEAIHFAFEFLTSPKWMDIPKEKLYVTIYPEDAEAKETWLKEGFTKSHIIPLDGNFWEIGNGPCGPDTEIFYDLGERFGGDEAYQKFIKDEDQDRYVEIWNNVFSQFNSEEGKDRHEYKELPHKNIDTGAGLERWAMIFQEANSIFETDLFMPIIKHIEDLSGQKYAGQKEFKVIADHMRAITFGLADGASFSNTGRGYVLRRLLRRSVRFGKNLGIDKPFLHEIIDAVYNVMKESYPYLESELKRVKTMVLDEEELFHKTLNNGEKILYALIDEAKKKDNFVSGRDIFKLYDTYGFPYELSEEYLEEEGVHTSKEEFDKFMYKQVMLSKASNKSSDMNRQNEALMDFMKESHFNYDEVSLKSSVIGLFEESREVSSINEEGFVILEETPFYAESGGQVADKGTLENDHFKALVIDCFKAPNKQHVHHIKVLHGTLKLGDEVTASIDAEKRARTVKNHSSIHVIQKTLREEISSDIKQAGSYVDDQSFRFDFAYNKKISDSEILKIEAKANERLSHSKETTIEYMTLDEAEKKGALAFFTDKYEGIVRVVSIGDTMELCGGTHVKNISDIKKIAILSLSSIGSNIYRIEGTSDQGVTREVKAAASTYIDLIEKEILKLKDLKAEALSKNMPIDYEYELLSRNFDSYGDILYYQNELETLREKMKTLYKDYEQNLIKESTKDALKYFDQIKEASVKYLVIKLDNSDMKEIKALIDTLKEKEKLVIMCVNKLKDNYQVVISSSTDKHAGNLLRSILSKHNGKGGGSPSFASGATAETFDFEKALVEELNG